MSDQQAYLLLGIFALAIFIYIYMIPSIVAYRRRHRHRLAILWLNILGGLSGVLWLGALVWALMDQPEQRGFDV